MATGGRRSSTSLSSRISKLPRRWSRKSSVSCLQPASIVLGGLDDLAGPLLGGADDLGALHHPLGLHPGGLEQFVGFAPGLVDELLALLEHPARLAHLVRQPVQRLLEQFDDLVAVDARRRRQRHRRRRGDDVDGAPQQRLGIADVAGRARRGSGYSSSISSYSSYRRAVVVAHRRLVALGSRSNRTGECRRRRAPAPGGRSLHRTSRSPGRSGC